MEPRPPAVGNVSDAFPFHGAPEAARRRLLAAASRPRVKHLRRQHDVQFHAPVDADVPECLRGEIDAALEAFRQSYREQQERKQQEELNRQRAAAAEAAQQQVQEDAFGSPLCALPRVASQRRQQSALAVSLSLFAELTAPAGERSGEEGTSPSRAGIWPILVTTAPENEAIEVGSPLRGGGGRRLSSTSAIRTPGQQSLSCTGARGLLGFDGGDEHLSASVRSLNPDSFRVPDLSASVRADSSGKLVTAFELRKTSHRVPIARTAASALQRKRKVVQRSSHYPIPIAPVDVLTPRREQQQAAKAPKSAVDEFLLRLGLRHTTEFSAAYDDETVRRRLSQAAAAHRCATLHDAQQAVVIQSDSIDPTIAPAPTAKPSSALPPRSSLASAETSTMTLQSQSSSASGPTAQHSIG